MDKIEVILLLNVKTEYCNPANTMNMKFVEQNERTSIFHTLKKTG